jgi:N-methylhydantoinase A/oxoprolinase/acetone carboxylase beta subunit
LPILLGLDTGGTYTDAVLLDRKLGLIASAKSLTTHDDLAQGIAAAIGQVLATRAAEIELVGLSTTLATNALVEGMSSPTGLILIGYEADAMRRSGLDLAAAGSPVAMIAGGHNPSGDEQAPLDEAVLRAAVCEQARIVDAFAVSSYFAVRNPSHEHRARAIIRELCDRPVTCGHELTSKLDAPRRALTTLLNARLISRITRLIIAVRSILDARGIAAPLMIVRGDGSMMSAELAMERPVETILSGPAASVIGAFHLSGAREAVIADIGGTTTDVALLRQGLPATDPNGATVGGWRTMTEAIAVYSYGLGGDSDVVFLNDGGLTLGPRRVVPLSLLGSRHPEIERALVRAASSEEGRSLDGRYVWRREASEAALSRAGRAGSRVLERLTAEPQSVASVVQSPGDPGTIDRLVMRGLAMAAGPTPSDAAHILGRHTSWSREAAAAGLVLAARGSDSETDDAALLAARVFERAVVQSAEAIVESLLVDSYGLARPAWGEGGTQLVRRALMADRDSDPRPLEPTLQLRQPLVAVGAPAGTYYPEVARRLGARLVLPDGADVANAIGAAVAGIRQKVQLVVTSPGQGVFRVHLNTGVKDFRTADDAIAYATTIAGKLAQERACRAGSSAPTLDVAIDDRRIREFGGGEIFVEAIVTATASDLG